MMKTVFFRTFTEYYEWLAANHQSESELWVGFHKRATGKPSLTWSESVDAALCYGWIDGVRKSIDGASYRIRFTPRKPNSTWSAVNLKKMQELTEKGLMRTAGLKVFQQRKKEKSETYSYEQRKQIQLDPAYEKKFKTNKRAWAFFQEQAPWYRRTCIYWIMSAKQEETRRRRLAQLIEDSENGRRIGPLNRKPSK